MSTNRPKSLDYVMNHTSLGKLAWENRWNPAVRAAYDYLCSHRYIATGITHPVTYTDIAEHLQCSERTVKRAMKTLMTDGAAVRTRGNRHCYYLPHACLLYTSDAADE